jgi:cytochrome c2
MKKYLLYCLTFLLFSCSSQLYVPTEATSNISLEDLKTGRAIYTKKCSSCHQLHLPNEYTEKVWLTNLNEMQNRAKISDTDKELIYQYITNAPKQK